jgi:hypothetical protein
MLVVLFAIKLVIAGFICVWSARQERGSIGAPSANQLNQIRPLRAETARHQVADYAGACHRGAPCADPVGSSPPLRTYQGLTVIAPHDDSCIQQKQGYSRG